MLNDLFYYHGFVGGFLHGFIHQQFILKTRKTKCILKSRESPKLTWSGLA